jgi:hypothetical protein
MGLEWLLGLAAAVVGLCLVGKDTEGEAGRE